MLLAMASGTALLGVVGYGLAHAAEQDRDRAELAARRDAHDLATALRAFLGRPEVVELVPAAARFTVRDGDVVVDEAVGWLAPIPASPPNAVIDERLRRAQLAEFVRGDAAAARACFDELLLDAAGHDPNVGPAAAWQAHRAGEHDRAARIQRGLVADAGKLPPAALAAPQTAAAVVATALLAAARDGSVPDALRPLLAALPPEHAGPAFARLAELAPPDPALPARAREVQQRRALLAAVHARARELPARPAQLPYADGALLWFPDGDRARGTGAVVDAAWLAALPGLGTTRPCPVAGLPPLPDRGVVAAGAAAGRVGVGYEVVPGALVVAALSPPPPPLLSQPAVLVGAGLALVAVFAASAFAVLRSFRREAAAANARAEFLTGVTHELKTPVASIRLVADVLHDDDVPTARQREYFTLLAAETARLSALIDNVLDVGQIERGERAYDLRPCDLGEVVRDAATAFAPLARRAGMALELRADAAPAPAVADAAALQQALFAVCENARKYAASGGRLDVTTARAGDTFSVRLRDFGPGVPADERDAIFARFQRGSRHRSGTVPGVGLGLYLARRIAQHHGGTLACEAAADGTGACFVLTLPLAANAAGDGSTTGDAE